MNAIQHKLDRLDVDQRGAFGLQGAARHVGQSHGIGFPGDQRPQNAPARYYMELERAGHFACTNFGAICHDSIVAYGLAFMNHLRQKESLPVRCSHRS